MKPNYPYIKFVQAGLRLLLYIGLFSLLKVSAQCPTTADYFSYQDSINNFPANYPNCTEWNGDLCFAGWTDNITSLDSLIQLTSIDGWLCFYEIYNLPDLSGLENLVSIGGKMQTCIIESFTDFSELSSLTSIGGKVEFIESTSVTSLTGLDNLKSIGESLTFQAYYNLTDFTGLDSLESIGGGFGLTITNMDELVSLNGLNKLSSLSGGIDIISNSKLTNISALSNVISIGGIIDIRLNNLLTDISGIANIDYTTITNVRIEDNPLLSTCEVQSICDYLENGSNNTIDNNATGCNTEAEVLAACSIVPVTLANFYGQASLYTIQLFWQTESEINNKGFEIQRSPDGINWNNIGFLHKDKSTDQQSYQYIDQNPNTGNNYYRLLQVDYDGNFSFSDMILVEFYSRELIIDVYPNPASDNLFIKYSSKLSNEIELFVFDTHGKLVENWDHRITEIDLSKYINGVYMLVLQQGKYNQALKFTVLK